jgi:hypothetical protein
MPRRKYQPVGKNERLPDVAAQRLTVKKSKRCNYAMSITKVSTSHTKLYFL